MLTELTELVWKLEQLTATDHHEHRAAQTPSPPTLTGNLIIVSQFNTDYNKHTVR